MKNNPKTVNTLKIEQIRQIVQSYFNFRAAILRSAEILSKADFSRITGLDGNSKYRRLTNPTLWQPVEIYRLAFETGFSDDMSSRLKGLASIITDLPDHEKKVICKSCCLTPEKLNERMDDPNSWQSKEMENLQKVILEYYQ